jgi:hypothetical protein
MSQGRFESLGLVAKEKVRDWQINACILGGLRFANPERSDETVSAHKLEAAYLDDPSAIHLFPYRHIRYNSLVLVPKSYRRRPSERLRMLTINCWL